MAIGIVGAGISGRLLAWHLVRQGERVTLFDKGLIQEGEQDNFAAAYTAAGMLTPVCEADVAEQLLVSLGLRALSLWPATVAQLDADVAFNQSGSLVVAHSADRAELANFCSHLSRYPTLKQAHQQLHHRQLAELEPGLAAVFRESIYICDEACLSPPSLLRALAQRLVESGAELIERVEVGVATAGKVIAGQQQWDFDHVVDCRGLGAKPDLPALRAVRGETMWVHASEVDIRHIVRLMHPRYRIYIVPRGQRVFVVGATQIESASMAPITVRSSLELLSALYSVHTGFAEAHILQTRVNCRPALPDNLPLIQHGPGLIRVNGLFRHGILLAPAIVEDVLALLRGEPIASEVPRQQLHCASS